MSSIVQPYFWSEEAAHAKLGRMVWPCGPECPHCGNADRIGAVTGKGARTGLKFCPQCRKQFRVTMATIFDSSHVPLHKWLQACFLLACCDSRISAHQLHLKLEVTNKTALRMMSRLDPLALRIRRDRTGAALRPVERETDPWVEAVGLALGRTKRAVSGYAPPQPPLPATRQFLGFVETVRSLGRGPDDSAFEAMLAASKRVRRPATGEVGSAARSKFPAPAEILPAAPAG